MNRKQRREAQRGKGPLAGKVCEHGNLMKTDGRGIPECPHGCGFTTRAPAPCELGCRPHGTIGACPRDCPCDCHRTAERARTLGK